MTSPSPAKTILVFVERIARRVGELPSAAAVNRRERGKQTLRPSRRAVKTPETAARAWVELYEHPALQWMPPLWRPLQSGAGPDPANHVVRALERNLHVRITQETTGIRVHLATGPLTDSEINGRVHPTKPAARPDPRLDVDGPTFEQALVRLRDAVVREYGPCDNPGPGLTQGQIPTDELRSCRRATEVEASDERSTPAAWM